MRRVTLQMGMSLDGYVASDGGGQALFAELSAPLRLELVEARSFSCGVVVHVYRPR
jgi:riboflavin biosynthesis pyrimidine reductase